MSAKMGPGVRSGRVVTGENPSNHVFVEGAVECPGNLLGNTPSAPSGIAVLYLEDGFDVFFVGSPGSGLAPLLRGGKPADFPWVRIW